jgi:hypothetical protein
MDKETEKFNNWNWLWMVPLCLAISPFGWVIIMLLTNLNWIGGIILAVLQFVAFIIIIVAFIIINLLAMKEEGKL